MKAMVFNLQSPGVVFRVGRSSVKSMYFCYFLVLIKRIIINKRINHSWYCMSTILVVITHSIVNKSNSKKVRYNVNTGSDTKHACVFNVRRSSCKTRLGFFKQQIIFSKNKHVNFTGRSGTRRQEQETDESRRTRQAGLLHSKQPAKETELQSGQQQQFQRQQQQ